MKITIKGQCRLVPLNKAMANYALWRRKKHIANDN